MNLDPQKAQDLITALEIQKNDLSVKLTHVHADLIAAHRKIAELEKIIAKDSEPELPKAHRRTNGSTKEVVHQ